MAATTPGPWNLGRPGGPAGPFWSIVNQQGNVVALQIVNEPDATLCAASPDLLEAGELVLALDDAEGILAWTVRRMLEMAIARAKGEQA